MAAPAVTVSGTASTTDGAATPVSVNLTGGVSGDIAVVFISSDQGVLVTANGTGWTKVADVLGPSVNTFPTSATTGTLGASLTAVNPTGSLWRTSTEVGASHTTEVIGGNSYKVYTAYDFSTATTYLYADDPYVKFKTCKALATGQINNTSALIQTSSANLGLIIEDCDFDGGASFHNRGVQANYPNLIVRRSKFERFGAAAIEKDDSAAASTMLVEDCWLQETKGWVPADHVDGIQIGGSASVIVRHNTVWVEPYGGTDGDTSYVSSSCIAFFAEIGNIGAVEISNNQMAGGGACIYVTQTAPFVFTSTVSVHDNVFDRSHFASTPVKACIFFTLYPTNIPAALNDTTWVQNTFENGAVLTFAAAKL